jgi:pyruvate dehydrogenase E2 component (dihydrolipoamide acetyltransferase)
MPDITMPQLGETVTEGTITRWMKKVGDRVEEDEVLYEVSTDKVDSEVPSPAAGFLAEILVQEGETAEVGARLAVIGDEPPSDGKGQAASAAQAEVPEEAEEAEPAAEAEAPEEEAAPAAEAEREAEPEAEKGSETVGGPEGATGGAEVARERETAPPSRPSGAGTRPPDTRPGGREDGTGRLLSPVVRRLIAEHDLDPSEIKGTGTGGRITRADVLALIDERGGRAQAAPPAREATPAEAAPAPARETAPAPARDERDERDGRDEVVPFSNIRRRTAEHMVRSLATSAHTLVAIEVDYEQVESVRQAHKERFKADEGVGLTYLPFVARAVVDAIRDFPRVNSTVGDDELIVHRYVNLGIAVDLNFEGLIVPVVHDADGKRLRALAREFADLAARARSKKLGADDISGGTFTITNAGGYGTLLTAPIINQPQVAILSTDGVKPKPVAVSLPAGGYGVAVHHVGNLAISFDHRAVDGAYAAAFLARIKEIIETRDWSQEL